MNSRAEAVRCQGGTQTVGQIVIIQSRYGHRWMKMNLCQLLPSQKVWHFFFIHRKRKYTKTKTTHVCVHVKIAFSCLSSQPKASFLFMLRLPSLNPIFSNICIIQLMNSTYLFFTTLFVMTRLHVLSVHHRMF